MASNEQQHLFTCIGEESPKPGSSLCGYVVMAEWQELDGQKFLTRLVGEHTSSWAAKGYLHEGLYSRWPPNPNHHNPGHSGRWTDVSSDVQAGSS